MATAEEMPSAGGLTPEVFTEPSETSVSSSDVPSDDDVPDGSPCYAETEGKTVVNYRCVCNHGSPGSRGDTSDTMAELLKVQLIQFVIIMSGMILLSLSFVRSQC